MEWYRILIYFCAFRKNIGTLCANQTQQIERETIKKNTKH
jgi:hypothetical protein